MLIFQLIKKKKINADIPLKKYPEIFLIVRNRDARVADYIEF